MAITGTQQPVSPSVQTQPNGAKIYTRVFKYDRDYAWEAEMPAVGSLDATYGYFSNYSSQNGPAYTTVTLRYSTEGAGSNFTPADGDSEYWAQTVGEEKPVEYHASYLTKWNYSLWGRNDSKDPARTIDNDYPTDGAGPGQEAAAYDVATDLSDTRLSTTMKWSKSDPGIEWVLMKEATKDFDFYIAPTRAVFQRDYHRQQSAAEAALNDVGKLVVPSETFGATPSTTANWLVNSSDTQYDGRYWVTETEYWHSENGWDSDIYSVP
jgi:hypothetical protein